MRGNPFNASMRSIMSWENSIRDPDNYQMKVLNNLLEEYAKTEYGRNFGAEEVESIQDYRKYFPIITYRDIKPHLEEVKRGNYKSFLSEEPSSWVLTRGGIYVKYSNVVHGQL